MVYRRGTEMACGVSGIVDRALLGDLGAHLVAGVKGPVPGSMLISDRGVGSCFYTGCRYEC